MGRTPMTSNPISKALVRLVACGAILAGILFAIPWGHSAPPETEAANADPSDDAQSALESFNDLIGEWRGVGMPKRGSQAGAWIESAEWVWDFQEKTPAIRYDVKKGQ